MSVFTALAQMLTENIFKGRTKESLEQFVNLIVLAGKKYDNESAFDVTKFILEESRYLTILKEEKTEESRARIENINEMLKAIDEFDNIHEFVEHSSLVMDNESLESDFGGTVKIMTLHAAKGLEFELVLPLFPVRVLLPRSPAEEGVGKVGEEASVRLRFLPLAAPVSSSLESSVSSPLDNSTTFSGAGP